MMKTSVIITILLAIAGCTNQESVYIKDGKEYGVTSGLFRDRWWNYYERGQSLAKGEFYEEAIKDLQAAIEKRRDDQWSSRTYGMHFIDYFPHRELGIIYYDLNRYHEAVQELEESLKMAESAKAKYFLNKARKDILEETKEDRLPPAVKISSPLEGTITNKFSINLIGEIEDDYFVSSISINRSPLLLELSAKKVPIENVVTLERGINEIKVQASDLTGKTTEKILRIEVDREGPLITIEDQKALGRKVMLSGLLSDSTGITSFSINGKKIPLIQKPDVPQEWEFHQEIDLPGGTDTIILKAEDTLENVTRGELPVIANHFDSQHPPPSSRLNALPLLASYSFAKGAFNLAQYALLDKILDNSPPIILFKDLVDSQTVYDDALYLEGEVSDENEIRSLTVNGEPILKRGGKKIFFNHLIRLEEGGNRFSIEAVDIFGNRADKVINVIRKIPRIRQIGSRMSVSLLPLERKGDQSISGDAIYDSLIAAIVNQGRFRIVEREKMEEVLRELRLSQTELVDPKTASKVGKIVVADAILTGTIYETKNSIEVLTRLVNTETSTIVEAKDVFDEDKSLPSIKRLMEGLALKLKHSFPLLEGLVIKKEGEVILIDLGGNKRVKRDMGLILFREEEEVRHPVTGRSLGFEPMQLGEARVKDVYEEFSKTTMINKEDPKKVKIKDRVITK